MVDSGISQMKMSKLRRATQRQVESLGYRFNPNLPELTPAQIRRPCNDVVSRILSLYVCVACSYGFSKDLAMKWLIKEHLIDHLSNSEQHYLRETDEVSRAVFQLQVEALWALTWAAGYHETCDFSCACSDEFVRMFPNLKAHASSDEFSRRCNMRSSNEILQMLDLSYCLHWAIRDEELSQQQTRQQRRVSTHVITERRHALEWLMSDDNWDDVQLDT